ncbi:PepSY domain-containing protein [Methylosinus sp. KRF6]|uniref:PepSY-associated TM helix domain-containing protein n=1 Tax=Methylosinus sp. KRF6 TaxID=2846853 RepID=UPI001C0E6143|nr:PepSY-associated TM helix domain-containing protein [Methylosinus sp. KRF6]MBU3888037.1 PepSY domain-containing protein [Methylosinus sp. KRF6]
MSIGQTRIGEAAPRAAERVRSKGRLRRFSMSAHRWIGLVAGAYLVLAGLTGSFLAFWQDIDEWLNAETMLVEPPSADAAYRPLSEIFAAAREHMPPEVAPGSKFPIFMKFPGHRRGAIWVAYITGLPDKATTDPGAKPDISKIEGRTIFVDPYRAAVTGERLQNKMSDAFAQPFVYLMMSLHCALLWEPFGRIAIAVVGMFLLVSTFVGIALWWPSRGKWKTAIGVKSKASPERLVYDIHKTVGALLGLVLLVSIFSGVYMNFKAPWRALVSLVSPVRELPMKARSEAAEGRAPLGPDAIADVADAMFPGGYLQMLQFPLGAEGTYVVGKHADDEINKAGGGRIAIIDQYSGKALASQDPHAFTAGERFFEWQYPLHSGEAFGDVGRAFMAVFGVIPLILYVTGFIRWRHKRRARQFMKRRRA